MDARSFYKYQYNSAVNADGIVTDPDRLNIKLVNNNGNTSILNGATLEFNYPSADHLTITLNQSFASGQIYKLSFFLETPSSDLRERIKDSYGVSVTGTFNIYLVTKNDYDD